MLKVPDESFLSAIVCNERPSSWPSSIVSLACTSYHTVTSTANGTKRDHNDVGRGYQYVSGLLARATRHLPLMRQSTETQETPCPSSTHPAGVRRQSSSRQLSLSASRGPCRRGLP
ncbi:hypothetical protein LY78DRAFT_132335 [Colletotrichum sublineola]|nr:hypothetical protein LY78DRAFT_132335 [Colletotrichum sublineola]